MQDNAFVGPLLTEEARGGAPERPRIDLGPVLTGMRHLPASAEPARVFSELAAVRVPALCDDCVVDLEEDGGHRYRIRRPAPMPGHDPAGGPVVPNPRGAGGTAGGGGRTRR